MNCAYEVVSVQDDGAIIQFPDDLNGATVTDDSTTDAGYREALVQEVTSSEVHLVDSRPVLMLHKADYQVQMHFHLTTTTN